MNNEPYNPDSMDSKLSTIIANQKSSAERDLEFRTSLLARIYECEIAIKTLMEWRIWIIGFAAAVAFIGNKVWEYIIGHSKP